MYLVYASKSPEGDCPAGVLNFIIYGLRLTLLLFWYFDELYSARPFGVPKCSFNNQKE